MFTTISSFNQIEIKKKNTLVLCDIDDTLLYYPDCDKKCQEILKDMFTIDKNLDYNLELINLKNMYKQINSPSHTDYIGFTNLIKKLEKTEGTLMYLTARSECYDKITKCHLKKIDIDKYNFKIHYTNNEISKGEYIKKFINLDEWEEIIFIDDYPSYIESVYNLFPQIKCYNFVVKKK